MKLKQLINKSWYGTIGYISNKEDLDILETYILYNLSILNEFQNIIVATNYGSNLQFENQQLWKKYFPKCIIIDNLNNRGHNHGYADLDNLILDYCKTNNIEWLCKSANDMIFEESILYKEIQEADFYYLNGIGYGGMIPYNFNYDLIIEKDFYPQTNFYLINVLKTDYLNNKQFLDETYDYINSLEKYNGKIWEYIKNWSCEDFLKQCIIRNNLSTFHLISLETYKLLLYAVQHYNIVDSSHKNIMIDGFCHYAYINKDILSI
jgi:hypothetical protein